MKKRKAVKSYLDNGIRNAVVGSFKPVRNRTDVGPMWENSSGIRTKKNISSIQRLQAESFFWRTTRQQEIDYVEETP
ncbi:MAG: hypothetical protein U5L96_17510 [Owenweeksia sp.]|nr:hypothetical protein [Owenweeksia sp.]